MFQQVRASEVGQPLPAERRMHEEWWKDVVKTLQLRINDLEREVEAIRFAKTGPIDQDSAFWAVFQSLSKEDRRELRDLAFGMAKRREEESETMVLGKTSTPQEDQS